MTPLFNPDAPLSLAAVQRAADRLQSNIDFAEDLRAAVFKPHLFTGPTAERDACEWLEGLGFSVGGKARSPRGIMFGACDVTKWKKLRPDDRAALHGQMLAGLQATSIRFAHTMPAEAVSAVKAGIIARIAAEAAKACAMPEEA